MIKYEELEFHGYGATMMIEDQPAPVGTELVATMEADHTEDLLTVTGDGMVHARITTFGYRVPDVTLIADWELDAVIAFLEEAKKRIVQARKRG